MDISTKAILCRDGLYSLDDLWDADRCQLHSKKKGRIGVIIAYMVYTDVSMATAKKSKANPKDKARIH